MKQKKIIPYVSLALVLTLSMPAYADYDQYADSKSFSSNTVALISAEQQSVGYRLLAQ